MTQATGVTDLKSKDERKEGERRKERCNKSVIEMLSPIMHFEWREVWPVLMVDGVALFLMNKLLGNMMHALKMTPKLLWRRHFEIFIFL